MSQAGLVNNLNDGMAWGLFPLFFAAANMTLEQIGALAAIYPAVWGLGQLFTGALVRSRRAQVAHRERHVDAGARASSLIAARRGFGGFATGAALLGVGTAMVYPTLLAAIGDVAHPSWRASSVGVYRLWRDSVTLSARCSRGSSPTRFGLRRADLDHRRRSRFASGVVVSLRMRETLAPGSVPQGTEAA